MPQVDFWTGTSWKMNKPTSDAISFSEQMPASDDALNERIQRFVIPSFTAVREIKQALANTSVRVGAQNMHWEDAGAWTGEALLAMLMNCGLNIVELGNPERSTHSGVTDETVGLKTAAAVRHGLIPLVCIGETLEERGAGPAREVLERQVRAALSSVSTDHDAEILLAYKPVWTISPGGVPATSEYADVRQTEIIEVAQMILSRKIPCLYGGSVNPENCEELISCDYIGGLFIGRSAWDAAGYLNTLSKCSAAI